jgi:hypothetical protein
MSPNVLRNSKLFAIGAVVLALSGCAGDLNPVRDVFVMTGIGDAPTARPDFVEETRPERLDYVPVGTAATKRATPPKSSEEILAMEEELRRLQALNETSAVQARSLSLSPPPEPIIVEPIPAMGPTPAPAAANR